MPAMVRFRDSFFPVSEYLTISTFRTSGRITVVTYPTTPDARTRRSSRGHELPCRSRLRTQRQFVSMPRMLVANQLCNIVDTGINMFRTSLGNWRSVKYSDTGKTVAKPHHCRHFNR